MPRKEKDKRLDTVHSVIVDPDQFELFRSLKKRLLLINAEKITEKDFVSIQSGTRSINQRIYDYLEISPNEFCVLIGAK